MGTDAEDGGFTSFLPIIFMGTLSPSKRAEAGVVSSSEAKQALDHIVSSNEKRLDKKTIDQIRSKLGGLTRSPEAFVNVALEQSVGDDLRTAVAALRLRGLESILQQVDQARIESPVDPATVAARRAQPRVSTDVSVEQQYEEAHQK